MKKVLKWVSYLFIVFLGSSIFAVFILKWVPVYFTPTMFIKYFEQASKGDNPRILHHWVSIDNISSNMPQAVVASEDNLFLRHHGFDFHQIYEAQKEAMEGGRVRGASTISQQTAKNVFLWPGRNFIRKGLEAYFTVLIEFIWGKERIMEVYLNSIEMGHGIYGVQAVAEENFHTTAAKLTKRQAALIAATLPNPVRFNSAKPSPYILKRQRAILSLMGKVDKVDFK